MAEKESLYRKILVPLDGSELSEYALRPAGEIVRGCEVQEVVFLQVVQPFPVIAQEEYTTTDEQAARITSLLEQNARSYINNTVSRVRYAVKTEVITGDPAEVIVDYAAANRIDLIIMSTHGRSGMSRWMWGSVTEKVLRATRVPVLLVRAPGCLPQTVRYQPPPLSNYSFE